MEIKVEPLEVRDEPLEIKVEPPEPLEEYAINFSTQPTQSLTYPRMESTQISSGFQQNEPIPLVTLQTQHTEPMPLAAFQTQQNEPIPLVTIQTQPIPNIE